MFLLNEELKNPKIGHVQFHRSIQPVGKETPLQVFPTAIERHGSRRAVSRWVHRKSWT